MEGKWYTNRWLGIGLHALFWALFFVLPYLLRPAFEQSDPEKARLISRFYYLHLGNTTLRLILFYTNVYLLIPKLVYRKKWSSYFFILFCALGTLLVCDWLLYSWFLNGDNYKILNFFAFNLFPFFFVVIVSTAYRIIHDRIVESQRMKEKETENLKTELSFLRSQVSPHFMFNVLNNMVLLARKKSDDLEPSLIKLSSLLRYMLYETNEDKVLLEKESDYLRSYIDLQQQRFRKNVNITTAFGSIQSGYTIEPMLLIPFVENAFKHGTGVIADAQIFIQLDVVDGVLHFVVRNRFNDTANEPKDKTSGIGLSNVKRRLNLLYENSHQLHIEKTDGWFTVSLHLNLH